MDPSAELRKAPEQPSPLTQAPQTPAPLKPTPLAYASPPPWLGDAPPPPTDDEADRLAELRALEVLDGEPDSAYDDITYLAAEICRTPIALVSLVDEDRKWFKSAVGLDILETSSDLVFRAHEILHPHEILEVRDVRKDSRFASSTLVTSDPSIRFYAGVPLVTSGGHVLGTLCVMDRQPRRMNAEQRRSLLALSRRVTAQLELRRAVTQLARSRRRRKAAERERDRIFAQSRDLVCVLEPSGRIRRVNPAWTPALGWATDELLGKSLLDFVHPEDAKQTLRQLRPLGRRARTRTLENRFLHRSGAYRWLSWQTSFDREDRVVYASARDVTGRRNELESARAVQESLIPSPHERAGGFFLPAKQLGGDFYGWFETDNGSLAAFVGDVMGKGIPAALLTTAASMTLVAALKRSGGSLRDIASAVTDVNEQLAPYLTRAGAFVTLFVAVMRGAECQFVDAGHGQAIALHTGGRPEWLRGRGVPLGVAPNVPYQADFADLSPGGRLVFYTDGFAELANIESIEDWTAAAAEWPAEASAADIAQRLGERVSQDDARHTDDATLVVMQS